MNRPIRRLAFALGLTAFALTGCKKDAPAPQPVTPGETASADGGSATPSTPGTPATPGTPGPTGGGAAGAPEGFPAVGQPANIQVLEAGAEPRQALRYKYQAGKTEEMLMVMNMQMKMSMAGNELPSAELPAMELSAAMDVKEVSPSGDAKYEFRFTNANVVENPNVNPQILAATRQALQGVTTLKGEAEVTPRGIVKKAAIDASGITDPQLRQMMDTLQRSLDQMSVPLPEEAVGKGAKWTVKQSLEQQGMRLFQTSTMELVNLDGDKAELKVTLQQTAPKQTFTPPGMPAGATASIEKLESTGNGTMNVDLQRVVPSSKLTMKMSTAMVIEAQGQRQPMGMDMTIDMSISPK